MADEIDQLVKLLQQLKDLGIQNLSTLQQIQGIGGQPNVPGTPGNMGALPAAASNIQRQMVETTAVGAISTNMLRNIPPSVAQDFSFFREFVEADFAQTPYHGTLGAVTRPSAAIKFWKYGTYSADILEEGKKVDQFTGRYIGESLRHDWNSLTPYHPYGYGAAYATYKGISQIYNFNSSALFRGGNFINIKSQWMVDPSVGMIGHQGFWQQQEWAAKGERQTEIFVLEAAKLARVVSIAGIGMSVLQNFKPAATAAAAAASTGWLKGALAAAGPYGIAATVGIAFNEYIHKLGEDWREVAETKRDIQNTLLKKHAYSHSTAGMDDYMIQKIGELIFRDKRFDINDPDHIKRFQAELNARSSKAETIYQEANSQIHLGNLEMANFRAHHDQKSPGELIQDMLPYGELADNLWNKEAEIYRRYESSRVARRNFARSQMTRTHNRIGD